MRVELADFQSRLTISTTQLAALNTNSGRLPILSAPGDGKAWNVKQVYTNYDGSTAASGGNLRIRPNGSTDDVITPIAAATIMPSSDAAYALQPSTHELEEDAAIEVGASAAITAGNDVLEIVVVADKIDL